MKDKVSQGAPLPLEPLGENLLIFSFWWWLLASWFCGCTTPVSASVWLCLLFYKDTVIEFWAYPDNPELAQDLNLIIFAKTFSPNMITFIGTGDWNVDIFLGVTIHLPHPSCFWFTQCKFIRSNIHGMKMNQEIDFTKC